MSCAPHCCPGPHLLITICHLSCALHTHPLLYPLRPPPPLQTTLSLLYLSLTSQLLIPSHPFISFTDSPHNTRPSICCLSVRCSVLCTCSISCHFHLHLHLQLLHSFFPPSCTCVLLSFHGMVEHTEWVFPLKIHILILPALQG